MVNFQVSAPGTLNLFGEDLTCDDHNGLMASIDLRNTAKVEELPLLKDVIILKFSEINLYCVMLDLSKLRKFYKSCTFDDTFSEQILEFISNHYVPWDNDRQKDIVHLFVYLFAYVTYKENINIEDVTSFQVSLEAQVPTVSLGGLASIVVCITTCFLHWSRLRRDGHHELDHNDRAKILMYSKSCDKIFTYCMFKSDVTVSTYGSMLRYNCKNSSLNEVLDNMPNMSVLIIDTNVNLDTSRLISMKQNMINFEPDIANSILDSIRVISDTAFSVLKNINDMNKNDPTYKQDVLAQEKKLFPLIHMQQELNQTFVRYSEQMQTICKIARRIGLAGKCADFNNARHTYVWCPSFRDIFDLNMMLIRNDFVRNCFNNISHTNLNCDGVKIENNISELRRCKD